MRLLLKFLISLCFICEICLASAQPDMDGPNLDSIKQELITTTDISHKIALLTLLAYHYNADSTNQALLYAKKAHTLSLKIKDKSLQGRSLLALAEGSLYNDNYDQALQYAFSALDIFKNAEQHVDLAECYRILGWVFYDSENAEFAMQYHQLANQLYTKYHDTTNEGISLNAIGLVYQMKHEHDTAKTYFERALKIARQTNNTSRIGVCLVNLGTSENALGNYQSAISLLNQSLSINRPHEWQLSVAERLSQLAYSHLMLHNYKLSRELLLQSKALIEKSSSNTKKERLGENLKISSQLYKAVGNYTAAFIDLQEYIDIRNQILSKAKSDAVLSYKTKKETIENEAKIKMLQTQEELRSFQRNALATGIVLLVIIGLLLISRLKQKQKKENELYIIKQELIKKELDNAILEKESLNNKLEYKKSELKNFALYISQRHELIREFIDELNSMQGEIQKDLSKFNKVVSKFQRDLEINKDVQDFNISVEEIHRDFFYNLSCKFPDLTDNEKKLCAQIRLNLSIKDIASLNNISVKSAEMARYRLRKHFSLLHEENLNDFLSKF